jgi:hypothetical protein
MITIMSYNRIKSEGSTMYQIIYDNIVTILKANNLYEAIGVYHKEFKTIDLLNCRIRVAITNSCCFITENMVTVSKILYKSYYQ